MSQPLKKSGYAILASGLLALAVFAGPTPAEAQGYGNKGNCTYLTRYPRWDESGLWMEPWRRAPCKYVRGKYAPRKRIHAKVAYPPRPRFRPTYKGRTCVIMHNTPDWDEKALWMDPWRRVPC